MKYAVDSWNLLVQLKAAWSDLFQILCSLLNDSFAEYVYKNKHCNSFPGQKNRISMRKKHTKLVVKTNSSYSYRGTASFCPYIEIRRLRRGRYDCITDFTINKVEK